MNQQPWMKLLERRLSTSLSVVYFYSEKFQLVKKLCVAWRPASQWPSVSSLSLLLPVCTALDNTGTAVGSATLFKVEQNSLFFFF